MGNCERNTDVLDRKRCFPFWHQHVLHCSPCRAKQLTGVSNPELRKNICSTFCTSVQTPYGNYQCDFFGFISNKKKTGPSEEEMQRAFDIKIARLHDDEE